MSKAKFPQAAEIHVTYLKAFGIDASAWSYDRAYRLHNYFRPGDGDSAGPQPQTNPIAQAYLDISEQWMDEFVFVPGSSQGTQGRVVSLLPKPSIVQLRNSATTNNIKDVRNWRVVLERSNGSRTLPLSLATVQKK